MATRQHILLLLLLFVCGDLIAQHNRPIIKGRIADLLTRENLSNATITLIQMPDSIIINQLVSDKNDFLFKVNPGRYCLHISHIGYQESFFSITIQEKDSILYTGTLVLHKLPGELAPVIVKAIIPPVLIKNDTISYNTAAFATKPNSTVEELLKKLPGIQVDKNGNITVHGEIVQKIYIDGKEFFYNDLKKATQNLPADLVDKVEAFDDKSERAKFTGIQDNQTTKVINLKLKPEKKKGIFGNLLGGYGSEGRYSLKASANRFKGDHYISTSLQANKGGALEGSADLPTLTNREFSLNYRDQLNKKLGLGMGYSQSGSHSVSTATSNRRTFLADSSLVQESQGTNSSKSNNKAISINLDYQADSFNKVQIGISLSANQDYSHNNSSANSQWEKDATAFPINKAVNSTQQQTKRFSETMGINYHHRFRKQGRYWGINVNHGYSQNKGTGELASVTHFYGNNGLIIDSLVRDQQAGQLGNTQNMSLNTSYTEPISKDIIIDLSYNLNYSLSRAGQQTFTFNPSTHQYDILDSVTSNNFTGNTLLQQVSTGFNYIKKKWQCRLGVLAQTQNLKNGNTALGLKNIQQQTNTLMTSASGTFHISKQKQLEISSSGSSRQPTVEQLQPVPDYSNPLVIKLGNPGLKPEFSYTGGIQFRAVNSRGSSFVSGGNFSNTINSIVHAVNTNNQGVQQQQYVNVAGNHSISTYLSYGFPFTLSTGQGKGNANMSSNLSYSQNISLVNEEKNITQSISWNQQASLHYHWNERLFIDLSIAFNWNHIQYSLQSVQTTSFLAHTYSGDILYESSLGLTLSTNINCQFNNSRQQLPAQNRAVWNATLSKRLFNRAGELKLSAFDILNTNNNFNRLAGENYVETSTTQIIRQVFVLSFLYRFRLK